MGKRIFFYFILFVSSVLISSFYEPASRTSPYNPPPLPYTDKFLIGAMDSYIPAYLNYYDEAKFNTTRKYVVKSVC